MPQVDLKKICQSIGGTLYSKNVIGYCSVDLVTFPNKDDPAAHPYFWAVDISCELTDNAAVNIFFDILMEGQLNQ